MSINVHRQYVQGLPIADYHYAMETEVHIGERVLAT